jgi:Clp amino terminal domain, pathogenicity island component
MFERYTEKARRVIFFGRYEACQYGSPVIEPEHLLLGLLREDKSLYRWLPKMDAGTIRQQIIGLFSKQPAVSTAVDLPLSDSGKRVLKHAGDEADRLANKHIGTEHLLLALLEQNERVAARLLRAAGADAGEIRLYYAAESKMPAKPWSFQRASFRDLGLRTLSAETVEIHGSRWNVDYVRDAVHLCRTYNWHWHKATWMPRDVAIHRKTGRISFELSLAGDLENFVLVKKGWKKDHCFICHWEIFESQNDSEHGTGYTNGHDWLCLECYAKFWERPDFFSSSYSDIT